MRCAKARGQPCADLAHAARALADDGARRTPAHGRRERTGTIGVRKHVDMRQRRALEIQRQLLEVPVGLAGEADDDVRGDRGVRDVRADVVQDREVAVAAVGAAHRLQHAIGS